LTYCKSRILIIGLGYYARRTYLPVLANNSSTSISSIECGLDLSSQSQIIQEYLDKKNLYFPVYYTSEYDISKRISTDLENLLNSIVLKHRINSVIISTEPLAHFKYADWALSKGLNILMDKPITTEIDVSCSLEKAKSLLKDYIYLKNKYIDTKLTYPNLVFNLMSQRRFHPAFHFVKNQIREVLGKTNCPITSIQCCHSDGQWRFPTEIVEQNYHPYNQGYGKCSHSGYHAFDIVSWLLNSSYTDNKKPNKLELNSFGVFPADLINQVNMEDYRNLFSDFDEFNHYSESQFIELSQNYGEVDTFTNFTLKNNNSITTVGSINLIHNGSSQRNWPSAIGRDLYKGNGRIKHEHYYIVQGPFQAILYEAYQAHEDHEQDPLQHFLFGGKCHLDIHIFRNSKLFPSWKAHELFQVKDISQKLNTGQTLGIQEESRENCIIEFLTNIVEARPDSIQTSCILDHTLGTTLLSSVYQSMIGNRFGGESVIKQDI